MNYEFRYQMLCSEARIETLKIKQLIEFLQVIKRNLFRKTQIYKYNFVCVMLWYINTNTTRILSRDIVFVISCYHSVIRFQKHFYIYSYCIIMLYKILWSLIVRIFFFPFPFGIKAKVDKFFYFSEIQMWIQLT